MTRFARFAAVLVGVSTLTACSVEEMVRVIFPDNPDEAVAVFTCESNLDPSAVSPGGGNHGVAQLNDVHARRFPEVAGAPWSERYDPIRNLAYAKWLYDQSGWRPWSCRSVLR